MRDQGSSSISIKNRKPCVVPLIKMRLRYQLLRAMSHSFLNFCLFF